MLKIEKFVTASPEQMEIIIEGMRNPMNSWDRMDSYITYIEDPQTLETASYQFIFGENDFGLAKSLAAGGSVHAKYRRMTPIWVTINAPLYWWKEADTYQVGSVGNSCSTMHKIQAKEFELDDFSHEHMSLETLYTLERTIETLNYYRDKFLTWKDKNDWWQMIQILPDSYNQKRTKFWSYETLSNMYEWRRNHKLDEWHVICDWIEQLPYSELITGGRENAN